MMFRKFLNLYRERQARKPFADFEAQSSAAGATLAFRRVLKQQARKAETTQQLLREIDAGVIVPIDQPLPAERLAAAMKGLGIKRMRVNG